MGTWVECVKCGKWRFLSDVYDPSIIPEAWHCGMQMKYSTVSSNDPCAEPQPPLDDNLEKGKYVYTKFTVGSVVWAKLNGVYEFYLDSLFPLIFMFSICGLCACAYFYSRERW